ncbi:MAG: EAL domain-containing protein [Gallionella sp.]|nr:EAL domain-containing protein [Gallionella sp.]
MEKDEFDTAFTVTEVIERGALSAIYQPMVRLESGKIFGYVGCIRGPSGDLLCSPERLYKSAWEDGYLIDLENHCLETVLRNFVESKLPGILFLRLDISIYSFADKLKDVKIDKLIQQSGVEPSRVVLFFSGLVSHLEDNSGLMQKLLARYNERGFAVAVDEISAVLDKSGEKKALLPEYVLLDRYLVEDVDKEPVKFNLIKSLHKRMRNTSCRLIASGVDTRSEMLLLNEIGIPFGMGDFISRASKNPLRSVSRDVLDALKPNNAKHGAEQSCIEHALLERVQCFQLDDCNEEVFILFEKNPQISVVCVVNNGVPIGLINRGVFINRYARPYQRELYGKKPCTTFMDPEPLVVDKNISIQELSRLLAENQRHISMGFIFTDNGQYLGVGTSQNLIHEITEMQIQSARYANPLTGLPGNARIDEEVDALLRSQESFCLAYFDLDNFKPFNDVYGFSMGDAVIQMTAKIIVELSDAELDFVGHIGGDDFIALFRSNNWNDRCNSMLNRFANEAQAFFSPADLERGGYVAENRRGEKEFHTLVSLSIGAVVVVPGTFRSHKEVAVVATESKKMAKKVHGNSLYINQRQYPEVVLS